MSINLNFLWIFTKIHKFISLDFFIFILFICLDNFNLLFLHTE